MFYQEYQPHRALSKYVKCLWVLEVESPTGFSKEKILPDGCMELIFNYGNPYTQHIPKAETQPRSFVYGQLKQYIEVSPNGKTGIIAVRFYPYGAWPFFHFPINEITGKAISVYHLLGQSGSELEERVNLAKNTDERLRLIQAFLLKRLKENYHPDTVSECTRRMIHSSGSVSVDSLAKDLCISKRQLERKFTAATGLSPKLFLRIIRFQNTISLLESKHINSLTALAYESGYYDQSHFIRDFKSFSGVNPTNYFKKEHPFTDLFTGIDNPY